MTQSERMAALIRAGWTRRAASVAAVTSHKDMTVTTTPRPRIFPVCRVAAPILPDEGPQS